MLDHINIDDEIAILRIGGWKPKEIEFAKVTRITSRTFDAGGRTFFKASGATKSSMFLEAISLSEAKSIIKARPTIKIING